MTTLAYTATDSATMLRRNLRRLLRYPSMTLLLIGMPIVFLLLFVYVFGGQLSHGLGNELAGGHAGRDGYLNYVTIPSWGSSTQWSTGSARCRSLRAQC